MMETEKNITFSDRVKEEIVNVMVNNYDYSEDEAENFAERRRDRIESRMWTTFDGAIEEMMEEYK